MGFLEEMAATLPTDRKEAFLAHLASMSQEEYADAEAAAKSLYTVQRLGRDQRNYTAAVRYNYADRKPEGRAATRRRKQLERANGPQS